MICEGERERVIGCETVGDVLSQLASMGVDGDYLTNGRMGERLDAAERLSDIDGELWMRVRGRGGARESGCGEESGEEEGKESGEEDGGGESGDSESDASGVRTGPASNVSASAFFFRLLGRLLRRRLGRHLGEALCERPLCLCSIWRMSVYVLVE